MATNAQIKEFIALFGRLAVAECDNRIAAGKPFILPSVCMAQSALESDWGQAGLMKKANAFFGVKAGGSWTGKIYRADTWEVAPNGEAYNTVANFRAYDSPAESMADYYELTTSASRYSNALSYGSDKSKWLTPRQTVTALWSAGYATDNLYVEKIMNTLNGRNLDEWDDLITGEGTISSAAHFSFSAADLVQGGLQASDGGRAFTTVFLENAVALPWLSAFTVPADTTFTLSIPGDMEIRLARVLNDSIINDERDYYNGDKITLGAGELVAFHMNKKDLSDVLLSDLGDVRITFSTLPQGNIVASSVLAYFVKIE